MKKISLPAHDVVRHSSIVLVFEESQGKLLTVTFGSDRLQVISEDHYCLSLEAPLALALMGCRNHDVVRVGRFIYEIREIR